jgi:hypothetical protein
MARCPACGLDNPPEALECDRCHLASQLFDVVREAAGTPDSDPKFMTAIGEILAAVDVPESSESDPEPVEGRLASPSRFLSFPPGGSAGSPSPDAPRGQPSGLPALPPGGDVARLTRQLNEHLQLARRQGIDLSDLGERAREAILTQDHATLEVLGRDVFVRLASSLTEEYESALTRRHDLAGLVATSTPDVELESCRGALDMGDLAGAQRRLRHIEQELTDLEDHWATVQILVAECDLLASTVRELGGDPEPALGPLAEGRRLARNGEREAAEPVLARAALALWSVLDPPFLREVSRMKDAILRQRRDGRDVTAAVEYLRQLAADLRHRNFASAIGAYRQLRGLADGPTVPVAADSPSTGESPPSGAQ